MGKNNSEIENEVYKFIKILVAVVIIVLGLYFFTNKFVTNNNGTKSNSQEGVISSNNIIVGSLLNRPYDSYYVLAYKSKDNDAAIYETYIGVYETKENALRIYVIDLDNELNKEFYQEKGNKNAKKIEDLKISSPTLIKVSHKSISKYIEGKDAIKKELGI